MKRDYRLYLEDILEAIRRIERYVEGMDQGQFMGDDRTVDAVIKNLAVIGEAAKHVPPAVRRKYPHFFFQAEDGIRDKLVHEYFGVMLDVLWKTVQERLPQVRTAIQAVLREMDKERAEQGETW